MRNSPKLEHFGTGPYSHLNLKNVFNDVLNTFYLWLYGTEHMVKDHSDIKRGNPLLPLYGIFYMYHPTDRIAMTFVTEVVEHWLERYSQRSILN